MDLAKRETVVPVRRETVPRVSVAPVRRETVNAVPAKREARTALASLDRPPPLASPVPTSQETRPEDPVPTVDTSADNPEIKTPDPDASSIVAPELAEERRPPREEPERVTGDP